MADTNAPPGASAETEELVSQLRDLFAQRRDLLDEIRRGAGHADRDAILLELCGFRGMQYTEAGAQAGYTREGVARRVRPQLEALGIAGLTHFERTMADIERPLRGVETAELIRRLQPKNVPARTRRELARQARAQRADIVRVMTKLNKGGMSWVDMAKALEVSVPTIQRIRGVM